MKTFPAALLSAFLASTASAADPHKGHEDRQADQVETPATDPHAGHAPVEPPPGPPPEAAFSGPAHAADILFGEADMVGAREQLRGEHGAMTAYRATVDRLETPADGDRDGFVWDAQAWYGGDVHKLWIKSEGEGSFDETAADAEVQALWSRAVTPWFDVQAGLRHDFQSGPERSYLVLGLQGLAPYRIKVDAAAFVSDEGDVSGRLEAEYDLLVTQRLILQPRAEIGIAVQEVPGLGSGIGDLEFGLRLRYALAREFAPYLGVQWERTFGDTADFARSAGEDTSDLFFVAGLHFWF
jgi:copper resistance protein B